MTDGRSDTTVTYEIETEIDSYRITIPKDWKVTFGDVHPGSKDHAYRNATGVQAYVLRIYESDSKQRMLFRNVISFRDVSIPLTKLKVTRTQGTDGQWVGEDVFEWEEVV